MIRDIKAQQGWVMIIELYVVTVCITISHIVLIKIKLRYVMSCYVLCDFVVTESHGLLL